jgi:ABC-2 type transport system ATP-binding protein
MKSLLSRLDVQGFVLDINQSLEIPPSIPDFEISLEDSTTLNVTIKKDQSINDLFNHLSTQGILVTSMRNQSNRLEEMFIEMVKKSEL